MRGVMIDNKVILEEFRGAIEITASARFQANVRLSNRQAHSNYMVALLSTIVIVLSLIPNFDALTPQKTQILLSCSIVLSVFIIFTSLIDSSNNYYHRGEALHQCAKKILAIGHEARLLDPEKDGFEGHLSILRTSYRQVLDDCLFNHERVDYVYARLENPRLFPGYYSNIISVYVLQRATDYIKYGVGVCAWLIPHALVVSLIIIVVFKYVL
jgi:hypothetical protein